ncbi:tetratricopeptide repeat protein [Altererythrobacter sp. ZODW24]|uniref:tetratricopeptide repeat protein n=1 Tax=Altererythrobacter sp. ZODW24 TaxID=2185142 RepID=UPI000DF7A4A5|nr:tetratricopeptide repeat protein [Altererythrobacter sp. ZODW24]
MFTTITLTALLLGSAAHNSPASPPPETQLTDAALAALDPTRAGRSACRGFDPSAAILDSRLQLAASLSATQPAMSDQIKMFQGLSPSDIPATGLNGNERAYFDQAMALTFGFNHAAAIKSFRAAKALSKDCAMCWWGEAMAHGMNINAGMSEEQNRAAIAAIKKAVTMTDGLTPLEQGLIAAQALRFPDDLSADRPALEAVYSEAMIELAGRFPEHDDLLVLAAESAMNTTPWDYWDPETAKARPQIATAIGLIEKVMERSPEHPQASHLYIHLMENSSDPKIAEAAADRLRDSGPKTLGHLVHMPAHIYHRAGRYADSMKVNIAAARADEEYLATVGDDGLYRFGYYPHNVHFLLTSAQMIGAMRTTTTESERLAGILNEDIARALPWVQAIHAAPMFAQAQYDSPAAILALNNEPSTLDYVEAMRRYSRAVAHARAGDEAGFDMEMTALDAAAKAPVFAEMAEGGFPANDLIAIAAHVAQGRQSYAQGKFGEAADHYRAASAIERTIPYTEPAYWYYPVTQSLGAALYADGDYEGAAKAFQKTLFYTPNNGWALYGLAKAERKLGHVKEAQAAEAILAKIWQGSDSLLRMDRL